MVRRQSSTPTAIRVRAHRQRLREQGLRPIQIWVPDVRSPQFTEQAHQQSLAVGSSQHGDDDQAFLDALRRVRRGEIWTAAAGSGDVGKPRPVVIVQDDRFDATTSVTVCAFTTDPTDAPLIRLLVDPDDVTGIREPSRLMVERSPRSRNRSWASASADSAMTT